jgi:hypothetical protein
VAEANKVSENWEREGAAIIVPPGSKRFDQASIWATREARRLIRLFDGKPAGLTEGGRWHDLTIALRGKHVDVGYLRREHKRARSV